MASYEERLRHIRRRRWEKADWARGRRRGRELRQAQGQYQIPPIAEIFDPENLIRVFYFLKRNNGQAPGPDRVTYRVLSHREVCQIMRDLSREVLAGRYKASRRRIVRVRKPGGGYRELSIRSIVHRVIGAALNQALAPYWETIFLDCSYGFRPARNVFQVFAGIEYAVVDRGLTVIAQDDIRKAFDFLRIDDVMDAHRRYIHDDALLGIIEAVLRDPHEPGKTVGIDQGGPYSPTAMNVLLHVHLDARLHGQGEYPSFFRYADNLVVAVQDVSEGRCFLGQIRQLLHPTGLSLKGEEGPPADLSQPGTKVTILGLGISLRDGQIRYMVPEMAWLKLDEMLLETHEAEDPPRLARAAIAGWIQARGPALAEQREPVPRRILQIASRNGYREITGRDVLRSMQSAQDRWRAIRESVRQELSNRDSQGARPSGARGLAGDHAIAEAAPAGP